MRTIDFRPEFVEFIPSKLADGVLYISIQYATVSHLCACGCGTRVVTPLSPPKWSLTFDGDTVSLSPSIGNWQFPCRSHYWISRNRVRWARQFSEMEIAEVRRRDTEDVGRYQRGEWEPRPTEAEPAAAPGRKGFLRRLGDTFRRYTGNRLDR